MSTSMSRQHLHVELLSMQSVSAGHFYSAHELVQNTAATAAVMAAVANSTGCSEQQQGAVVSCYSSRPVFNCRVWLVACVMELPRWICMCCFKFVNDCGNRLVGCTATVGFA
jgi:hypothetical protein